jgi:uncharacterized protein YcfJ
MSAALALVGLLVAANAGMAAAQDSGLPTAGPRQVCRKVRVQDPPRDNHQVAGTLVGAAAGGLVGNQFGGGKGKVLTTAGGVVAGGYAGKEIQESHQANNATYHYEERCHDEQ